MGLDSGGAAAFGVNWLARGPSTGRSGVEDIGRRVHVRLLESDSPSRLLLPRPRQVHDRRGPMPYAKNLEALMFPDEKAVAQKVTEMVA